MLGFTLAVAVFIDATVVRMIVGPALLKLAATGIGGPLAYLEPRQRVKKSLSRESKRRDAPLRRISLIKATSYYARSHCIVLG